MGVDKGRTQEWIERERGAASADGAERGDGDGGRDLSRVERKWMGDAGGGVYAAR